MSIINLQRNHTGIQSLNTQFANYTAAGQGAMLSHTDGYVYCVFAQNYLNGVANERRLYVTRSNDGGLTWSTKIQISISNWDDDPAIIQLDTTDVNSDIGVVFSRNDTLTRFTFNKEVCDGVTSPTFSPYDPIEYPGSTPIINKKWPSIVYIPTVGFQIWCLVRDGITTPGVYQYSNASFTTNTWVETIHTGGTAIFPTNGQPMSLSVKLLTNGDLAMVGAYRTNLNGQAQAEDLIGRPGMSNLPKGMLRCDVGAFFSSDNGSIWTSVQNLTNYAGTPALDLAGIMSVASADLQQLNDGAVVVAYQEHTAPQYIDPNTSPFSVSSSISSLNGIRYHAAKNVLIYGIQDATLGGVFILDLTAQTSVRIQSPTIWTDNVIDLDISPDGTKMAVALSDGGINIFDITDPDPNNWSIITNGSLRTTSTPALHSNSIVKVRWDGNSNIAFNYNTNNPWGGYYDINAHTLVDLYSYGENFAAYDFVVQATKIIAAGSYFSGSTIPLIDAISKTTGLSLYHYQPPSVPYNIYYDTIHSEYLALYANSNLVRLSDTELSDTGSAFYVLQTFSATSNPSWSVNVSFYAQGQSVEIPGQGIVVYDSGSFQHLWYSYVSQQPAGYRVRAYRLGLGENVNHQTLNSGGGLKSNTWLALGGNDCLVLQSLSNVGRIRYGFFPYNTSTHQLTPAGVDFYDVCNVNKVGTNMQTLQFPKFCADNNSNLFWYFNRWDLLSPGGDEFAPVLGVTALDAVSLTARCWIRAVYTPSLTARCKIQALSSATLTLKARIAHMQCLKMRAHIVGFSGQSISMMARVSNYKASSCIASFSVQSTRATSCSLTFYAGLGYNSIKGLQLQARIVGVYTYRTSGHFIVTSAPPPSNIFTVLGRTNKTLSIRARIV